MDLQRFCSKDPMKYEMMGKPFNQGGKTWATNGWVAVGVPERPEVEARDWPNIAQLVKGTAENWHDVPVVQVAECKMCGGEVVNYTCHECKGAGTVTLRNEYTTYSGVECGSCDGEGEALFCPYCSGTGVDSPDLVRVGQAWFKANALWLIKDLPGIQIAPTGQTTAAFLRFDGGEGFLMPTKPRTVS